MLGDDGLMVSGDEAVNPGVTNEFGIDETLDIVKSLVKIADAVKVTLEDGKFSPMEAFNFTGALISLPSALTGLDMIPAELSNLSNEEVYLLIDEVKETLDYADDDKVKVIIEKALVAGLAIKDIVDTLKNG